MEEDEEGVEQLVWSPECTVSGHSGGVWSVAFSPDGKHFVSGSMDKFAKIWNTETGAEVRIFVGLRGVW
jgi:WD40 repeat protein